jgi:hypothetical protein
MDKRVELEIKAKKLKIEKLQFEIEKLESIKEPAEPVVLSAKQILSGRTFEVNEDFIKYGEAMHQNGRLDMYLDFKKAFKESQMAGNFKTLGFKMALKNLKPLNQD